MFPIRRYDTFSTECILFLVIFYVYIKNSRRIWSSWQPAWCTIIYPFHRHKLLKASTDYWQSCTVLTGRYNIQHEQQIKYCDIFRCMLGNTTDLLLHPIRKHFPKWTSGTGGREPGIGGLIRRYRCKKKAFTKNKQTRSTPILEQLTSTSILSSCDEIYFYNWMIDSAAFAALGSAVPFSVILVLGCSVLRHEILYLQ